VLPRRAPPRVAGVVAGGGVTTQPGPPPDPHLEAARTAAPHVGQALTVVEGAGLDLFLIACLRDALGVLAEDYLGVAVTDYLDAPPPGPSGGQAGRPPPSSPPTHDDAPGDACPPPSPPGQRP